MKLKKLNLKNMKLEIGFNKKLYLDGIRQLRLVGIMGMVVLCASALLTAVGCHISTPGRWYDEFGNLIERAPQGVSLFQCHWALFLTFPILVPIMTMILFNFLNHRNASDFYHSIPDTRGTLYISYAAAILSWVGAIIGISTLLSVFCISILPGYYILWSGVPKALFLIIAASVLVMGGIMIALGLTGTRMSNLMVTLIILFLPRIFVTVVMYILEDMMSFVAWEYSPSLFNPRYDLIAGIPLVLFSGVNPFAYWSSGVYSLVLGLIYLAVGYVIFLRRKSESAGHAAISPKLQGAFRLAISMMVCLLPMYFMTECWMDPNFMDSDTLFFIVVFYVIAVLAYFIYELMTTGKLRGFKKLCKGLGLLAGLNVVLFLVIIGIYGVTVANTPDGDDIDYVMLRGEESDYFGAQLQRIRIRDDEVAELTSNALKRAIDQHKGNYNYGSGYYVETVRKTVAINVGMRTIYRDVLYTTVEWNQVVEHLSQLPEYYQTYCELPKFDSGEMSIWCESSYNQDISQLIKIYEVMREEVKTIDFEEWYTALDDYYNSDKYVDVICITLDVGNTGNRDTIRLPILFSMPKTMACYFEQQNQFGVENGEEKNWEMIRDLIDGKSEDGMTANYLSVNLSMRLIKGDEILDGIDGWIEGIEQENGWELTPYGIAKEKEDVFLTFVDKLIADEYVMDTTENTWIVIDLDAYAGAYNDKEWSHPQGSYRFCIPLTDPVPEEMEELFGEVIEKLNQLTK